jgi:1,4-dihydroxy-2-naphthoate octaprenyltransferase
LTATSQRGDAAARPGVVTTWLLASRPKTLSAAVAPVAVGTAWAWAQGAFHAGAALAAFAGALFIQLGTNYANDLFDFRKGADTPDRLGPVRVTAAGLVSEGQIAVATALAFGAATACGLYLVAHAGWPLVVIGVMSILAGLAYTGGPFPLGYNGLGDLFVFAFFGVVATAGTYFVQALAVDATVLWLSVPVGTLSTAILVVNNLRDVETDRTVGKRTLAVLLGPTAARWEYLALVAIAFAVPAAAWAMGEAGPSWLLPLLSLPLAVRCVRDVFRLDGAALNPLLGRTAGLHLVFGLLLAGGVIL